MKLPPIIQGFEGQAPLEYVRSSVALNTCFVRHPSANNTPLPSSAPTRHGTRPTAHSTQHTAHITQYRGEGKSIKKVVGINSQVFLSTQANCETVLWLVHCTHMAVAGFSRRSPVRWATREKLKVMRNMMRRMRGKESTILLWNCSSNKTR